MIEVIIPKVLKAMAGNSQCKRVGLGAVSRLALVALGLDLALGCGRRRLDSF